MVSISHQGKINGLMLHPHMRFVGIDPGKTGALVVVGEDGVSVVDVQSWSRASVPPVLRVEAGDIVTLEGLYVGKSRRGSMSLAEWTGMVRAQLTDCTVLRPSASEWRGKVLRVAGLPRARAKALAVSAAAKHAPMLATEDECEAWLMARYAWGWWRVSATRSSA